MAPAIDLRAKYGNVKLRQAIHRAIREEIAGGAEVLDLLALTHHAADRLGWEDADSRPSLLRVIHEGLCAAAAEMEEEVRQRYGLPPNRGEISPR